MKPSFVLVVAIFFATLCGIARADSGVYQYVPSEGMDHLMDHLRNVTMSRPTLAANGVVPGNLNVGGTAGDVLLMRVQNKLVSYDVATAKTIVVDAVSGVSWYSSAGIAATFAGIKTVAAGECSGFLVLADDTATTPAWALVRAPSVTSAAGAKAKIPDIPKAILKTHSPVAFIKINNTTSSAVVLGTLALSDAKVTLLNLSCAFPGEEL